MRSYLYVLKIYATVIQDISAQASTLLLMPLSDAGLKYIKIN